MKTLLFLSLLGATLPVFANEPDNDLARLLVQLRAGTEEESDQAAEKLATRRFQGWLIHREKDRLLGAMESSKPWVVNAAALTLANSSSWDDPQLIGALQKLLHGFYTKTAGPEVDRSLAVKPLLKRMKDEHVLEDVREALRDGDAPVVLAILEERKVIEMQLRHETIRPMLLEMLRHSNDDIALAALDTLFDTLAAYRAGVACFCIHLNDQANPAVLRSAALLLPTIVPTSEFDRANILAAFPEVLAALDPESIEGKLAQSLHTHFQTAVVKEAPKTKSKSEVRCPGVVARQGRSTAFRKGKAPGM